MFILGAGLIVAGLILVCGSTIFRWTRRAEPASSQDDAGSESFRLNDEMRGEEVEQAAERAPTRPRAQRSPSSAKEKPPERRPVQ